MDDALLAEVYRRLDEAKLDPQIEVFVMAACEDQLDTVLDGHAVQRRDVVDRLDEEPIGAYLTGVTVEGFRGIGPQRRLPLTPGPGLTVVVGRNGSGKSSFAEAVEVVLTGSSSRWNAAESTVWLEGWRNLHDGTPRLRVDVVEEGATSPTVLERTWAEPDDLTSGTTTVRRAGAGPEPLAVLGWTDALNRYRPILSYHELGTMLQGRPSDLHDALSGILGVGDLSTATDRLVAARRAQEQPAKEAKVDGARVLDRLRRVGDARATALLAALDRRTPDLDGAELLLIDDEEQGEAAVGVLRRVAALEITAAHQVEAAADELETALRTAAEVAGTDAGRAEQLARLLRQALEVHDAGEHDRCPVCRTGTLDEAWRDDTAEQIAALEEQAAHARAADLAVQRARAVVSGLVTPPPAALAQVVDHGIDASDADAAWQRWAALPDDPVDWPAHLRTTHPSLVSAVGTAVTAARRDLERRQAEWRPVAAEVLAWITQVRAAQTATAAAKALKAAETWLKDCHLAIKNARFTPVRQEAQQVWNALRLASNVELRGIALAGSATRRKVELDVAVDGTDANALGVMSQGELHALALAIFVPRATRPESPFRFLLIDDPVQSMDPARVDGLARVLTEVARRHQVIVFTHDDRLPESLRRLRLGGRVVGVTRQPGSLVTVRPESDPVTRAISDAKTMARSDELALGIRNRLVAGFLRTALEAACAERYTRAALGKGVPHREVEEGLVGADTLRARLCLALFGEATGNPGSTLRNWDARFPELVTGVNQASHGKQTDRDESALWSDVHCAADLAERLTA